MFKGYYLPYTSVSGNIKDPTFSHRATSEWLMGEVSETTHLIGFTHACEPSQM